MKQKPEPPKQVSVKIDREHYERIVDAAKVGTRSVAHQLRVILNLYFKGEAA